MMAASLLRRLAPGLLMAATLTAGLASAGVSTDDAARRIVHLLDYIAVDYGVGVQGGAVVDEIEYREQIEFISRVDADLAKLGVGSEAVLRRDLATLQAAIDARRPAAEVARRSRDLARAIRQRFDVHASPPRTPSLERGEPLYAQRCASCHGARGRGDGPLAESLRPRPADLGNRERMLALSLFDLYSTISRGIDGTAMRGFSGELDEAERYDLAFFVGSVVFDAEAIERGRELAELRPSRVAALAPDLAALVDRSPVEVAEGPQDLAILAFLRSHPRALRTGVLPLEVARQRLAESREAWEQGLPDRALELAVSAYLDAFETVEPTLNAAAPELRRDLERRFFDHRGLLREQAGAQAVRDAYDDLRRGLESAEVQLGRGLGDAAVFASALTILAREGFEAALIVSAILALLARAGQRDALRYVHAGWALALVAGGATWLVVHQLVRLSGAQREVVEGVSALLATAVLFYVSFWLLSKAEAARWQAYLAHRVRAALSAGSVATLAAVSFVAVYREALETALFYEALWAQAGPGATQPILMGVGAATLLLALLIAGVLHLGHRLPVPAFFTASSVLLYVLSVILAGEGIAALQEVGWVPVTWVPFPRLDWLGVRPTAEGLALQGALLAVGLGAIIWLAIRGSQWSGRRRGRRPPSAGRRRGPSQPPGEDGHAQDPRPREEP
jgi:high-affinity iron transporter